MSNSYLSRRKKSNKKSRVYNVKRVFECNFKLNLSLFVTFFFSYFQVKDWITNFFFLFFSPAVSKWLLSPSNLVYCDITRNKTASFCPIVINFASVIDHWSLFIIYINQMLHLLYNIIYFICHFSVLLFMH